MSPRDPYPAYPGDLPEGVPPPHQAHPPVIVPSPGPSVPPVSQASTPPQRPEGPAPSRPVTLTAALWAMVAGAVTYLAAQAYVATRFDVLREDLERQLGPGADAQPGFDDGFIDLMMILYATMGAVFLVVVLALWVWMIVANARGLGWARLTATCLGAYNIVSTLFAVGVRVVMSTVAGDGSGATGVAAVQDTTWTVLAVLQALIGLGAVGLLWLRPTSAYVREVADRRRWERWEAANVAR